ncbi:MAG: hypothetical protein LKE40_03045 [Spirochaetia bacterium]|nr:hypothetical protein [Spirochaetia bacterium]
MHNMKRNICLVVIGAASCLMSLNAGQNMQKIRSLDSNLIDAMDALYVTQGMSLPSQTAPYSDAELALMLSKINKNSLTKGQKVLYKHIEDALDLNPLVSLPAVALEVSGEATAEAYAQTNPTDYDLQGDWKEGTPAPFADATAGLWLFRNLYIGVAYPFGLNTNFADGSVWGDQQYSTNIPGIGQQGTVGDISIMGPNRAFISLGGNYWNLQIGRDRLKWGAGTTGNLVLGDNLPYQTFAKATAFGSNYKYTFLTAFYPYPEDYMDDGDTNPTTGLEAEDASDGLYMFMGHRLEWRMFHDKLGFALNETIMFQDANGNIDPRYISPAAIFHDYYIRANANSLLGFEMDTTLLKNLNFYGQVVVDEFVLPGEDEAGEDGYLPPALGYLAGATYYKVKDDGVILKANVEFAYTDPLLYLRYGTSQSDFDYGISYVVAFRESASNRSAVYENTFLGYPYGGDAIVGNLNLSARKLGKWETDINFMYMLHGVFDQYTKWAGGAGDDIANLSTPTTSWSGSFADDDYETIGVTDPEDRNAVINMFDLGFSGSRYFLKFMKVFAQTDVVYTINKGNISGSNALDMQLTVGCSVGL